MPAISRSIIRCRYRRIKISNWFALLAAAQAPSTHGTGMWKYPVRGLAFGLGSGFRIDLNLSSFPMCASILRPQLIDDRILLGALATPDLDRV
jgi:hypothetical protein